MKQKNLAMLGVAVGCGLVAAVAVAKLSAGGSRGPDTAKVLVAKKDLPVQTKLDDKEIDNLVVWADMPKSLLPQDPATDIEQVKGKSLNRTLKQGNPLSLSDLGNSKILDVPEGCEAFTIKVDQVGAVAGFAKPGAHVDIMYVEHTTAGKARAAIILKDMLVLAVGMINTLDEKTGAAIPQVENVTLAVNKKQATRLGFANERGTVKLLLTGTHNEEETKKVNEGDIQWIVDPFDNSGPPPAPKVTVEAAKMEKMVIVKKPVPLNTLINADNLSEFFTTTEVKTAPEGVVQNPEDLKGKYVIKPIEQGQIVFKNLTDSKATKIKKPDPTTPVAEMKPKLPRFEQVIQQGGKAHKVIWMEIAPSKWKCFESEKEVNEYKPEPPVAPKADESKGGNGKPVVGD